MKLKHHTQKCHRNRYPTPKRARPFWPAWQRWLVMVAVASYLAIFGSHYRLAHATSPPEAAIIAEVPQSAAVSSPLTLGKHYYDAGQYAEALTHWQAAVDQSTSSLQKAIAQNYLAIAHQTLGQWDMASTVAGQALVTLDTASVTLGSTDEINFLYAQILNTVGIGQLQTGQAEAALNTWEQAEALYRQQPSTTDVAVPLLRNQLNQVQALRGLGFYRQARQTLEDILHQLTDVPLSPLKVSTLHSLGITLRQSGDLPQSEMLLREALAAAHDLNLSSDDLNLSLAKTLAALGQLDQAITVTAQIHPSQPRLHIEAALLQLSLQQQQATLPQFTATAIRSLQADIEALPPSRWGIYAAVNLAAIAMIEPIAPSPGRAVERSAIASLLSDAIRKAQTLGDHRAESFGLGQLGHLYEQAGQPTEAIELTQQALVLAQQSRAADLTAKWQWQQGRLLDAQHQSQSAIKAYTEAVKQLEVLKYDLVAMNPELQFSFREEVEPVYLQLIGLLLRDVDTLPDSQQQQHLAQARTVAESLQLAELENYFRQTCLTYQTRPIETIDPRAAVLYSILLPDRLEVIFSAPNQPLRHHSVMLSLAQQQELFQDFYRQHHPLAPISEALPLDQALYDWLVRPFEAALQQQSIETLVFVANGFLRNLPMALLHNGEHYLVEDYQLAITPGLRLLNSQPLDSHQFEALALGISESRDGFSSLPAVEDELAEIQMVINAKTLLNTAFTKANFFNQVQSTSAKVIHLATHGQFSSSVQDTFLLAWDQRINARELDQMFRQPNETRPPVELLVLSACQTATGDDRSALGLAGVAVRSGARTTVAALWNVADASTAQLMAEFYHQITQPNVSRAEALRQAQLVLLHSTDYAHPYYWAPFVLVGNWQ